MKTLELQEQDLTGTKMMNILSLNGVYYEALGLEVNLIGDEDIIRLLESPFAKGVMFLRLDYNMIGDKGALAIVKSSKVNHVSWLSLRGNRLSAEGIKSVAKALPGSKIVWLDISLNPGSQDRRAYWALLKAAKKHKILTSLNDYSRPYSRFRNQKNPLKKVLKENTGKIGKTIAEVKKVGQLFKDNSIPYPEVKLDLEFLKRFEDYCKIPLLREELLKVHSSTCKRIQRYVLENYFKLTGVVCEDLQWDDWNSMSLAVLPPEVVGSIVKFLEIADVKTPALRKINHSIKH